MTWQANGFCITGYLRRESIVHSDMAIGSMFGVLERHLSMYLVNEPEFDSCYSKNSNTSVLKFNMVPSTFMILHRIPVDLCDQ